MNDKINIKQFIIKNIIIQFYSNNRNFYNLLHIKRENIDLG